MTMPALVRTLTDPFAQHSDSWLAFDRPWYLLVFPLLGLVVCLPILWRRRRPSQREGFFLAVRLGVLALAALALADPQWTWTSRALSVVVVHDVSDSIPPASQRAFERFVDQPGSRQRERTNGSVSSSMQAAPQFATSRAMCRCD